MRDENCTPTRAPVFFSRKVRRWVGGWVEVRTKTRVRHERRIKMLSSFFFYTCVEEKRRWASRINGYLDIQYIMYDRFHVCTIYASHSLYGTCVKLSPRPPPSIHPSILPYGEPQYVVKERNTQKE